MFRSALLALSILPTALLAQRSPLTRSISLVGAPQTVTAAWSTTGVQVAWAAGAGAAQYLVMRGPDANTLAQLAVLPASSTTYLDAAVPGPVIYQVISVGPTGLQAASTPVAYTPPASLAVSGLPKSRGLTNTRAVGILATPTISSVVDADSRSVPAVRYGKELLVLGTGFDGLTGVTAQAAVWARKWVPVTGSTPIPVTPQKLSSTSFTFAALLPYSPDLSKYTEYLLTVTKASGAVTSAEVFGVSGPLPVRKIVSVQQTAVLAGERFKITGVGFENVIGGYIGSGVPRSAGNPLLSMWNRGPTYVELATPVGCDLSGPLMLEQPQSLEGRYITPDTPITVTCVPATPSGTLETPLNSNQQSYVLAGSRVGIRGRYLKHVTRVIDQNGVSYPFTVAVGASTSTIPSDMISLTLPAALALPAITFQLDHALTTPSVPSAVPGAVVIIRPPKFTGMGPAWAEPGQTVVIFGLDLKWNDPPQVWVGGIPAQVVSAVFNRVEFKVPANATSGPVEIQNEGGRLALTAPFPVGVQQTMHPGFFLVAGPSVVTGVVKPSSTPAMGDMITVNGQNLARLMGICVPQAGGGYIFLRRPEMTSGSSQWITSNTTMQVKMEWPAAQLSSGAIQLYANTQPIGNNANYACVANSQVVNW